MVDKKMIETCYPQWLLGEVIEFKNSGEEYSICAVTQNTLMIGKGDGVLRTIRSTTKMIIGERFVDDICCDKLWTFKGQGLDVIKQTGLMLMVKSYENSVSCSKFFNVNY